MDIAYIFYKFINEQEYICEFS